MTYVGVDGCRAGWFAVMLTADGDWEAEVFPDVSSLWRKYSSASLILIDIPIGLREGGDEERRCDKKARQLLGFPRRCSVFRAPCRPAIRADYADSREKASEINEQRTGRRLSLQSWNIVGKIRQVDELLSKEEAARSRIREIHPEICFGALAGHPMEYSKRKPEGRSERREVLEAVYPGTPQIVERALARYRRKEVGEDDILDALAAAVTAKLGGQRLVSIPEPSEFDQRGLRMEMVHVPTTR